jgi:hypothetical protein
MRNNEARRPAKYGDPSFLNFPSTTAVIHRFCLRPWLAFRSALWNSQATFLLIFLRVLPLQAAAMKRRCLGVLLGTLELPHHLRARNV